MSCESRNEYISAQKRRYRRAGRAFKTRLLDEVCEICEYERKHAIKLLNGSLKRTGGKRGRKSEYNDPELIKALKTLWLRSGLMCSKRLKQAIASWLMYYEKHYGALSSENRAKLLKISPASIDRLLKPYKAQHQRKRNTGTKPGTLLKNQIPIRTSNEDIDRPGYLEADTVAHCGGSMSGSFIWSITYTDIKSTWTVIGIQREALQIRERIGYPLGVALSHGNIGLCLARQGKYDEAMKHQQIALRIRQSIDHKEGLGLSYQNIGLIHLLRNELDAAEASFKQSLDIFRNLGNLISVGKVTASLGQVAACRGSIAEAKAYFEQAEEILLSIGAVAQAEHVVEVKNQYKLSQ